MNYSYAYLVGSLIFGIAWLFIFIYRKDLRREILYISALTSLMGLTAPLFYQEYWNPVYVVNIFGLNVGLEDVLLMFFQGGIAATLYEVFSKTTTYSKKAPKIRGIKPIIAFFLSLFVTLLISKYIIQINIIYAGIIGMLSSTLIYFLISPKLIKNSIISGLTFGFLAFINLLIFGLIYPGIFDNWWQLSSLSGVSLIYVPLEEVIWHMCLGFVVGPLFEFIFSVSPKRIK